VRDARESLAESMVPRVPQTGATIEMGLCGHECNACSGEVGGGGDKEREGYKERERARQTTRHFQKVLLVEAKRAKEPERCMWRTARTASTQIGGLG
jgi:hypothetical protein